VGVLACVAALILSSASLFAERDTPLACCVDIAGCGGRQCCDFDPEVAPPCSDDQTGYCMTICIWPATRIAEDQ
jgi:hypothetical protein